MSLYLKKSDETTVSVTTSSTLVLAQNLRRKYALISNPTGGGIIFLAFGKAAIASRGVLIPPGGAYEIDVDNLWGGEVYAIASAGTIDVAIVDQY